MSKTATPAITYTLQVFGVDDPLERLILKSTIAWHEVLDATAKNLTDLLPAGYRVEIKEWDE